jgi:hypothetical protein
MGDLEWTGASGNAGDIYERSRQEIAGRVAEEWLATVAGRVSSVAQLAEFHPAAARVVAAAAEQDA